MKKFKSRILKSIAVLISAIVFALPCGSFASTDAEAVNDAKAYTVFSATGKYVSEYTLNANAIVDKSRGIIGTDDRKADDKRIGVVEIYTTSDTGTGFFVDAHTIATAAHCVFDEDNGNYSDSGSQVSEIYVYNEDGSYRRIMSSYHVHIPNDYIEYFVSKDTDLEYTAYSNDYALITVSESFEEYAEFNLGIISDDAIENELPVYTTGFPSDKSGKQTCAGNLLEFECDCSRCESMDYDRNIVFDMDVMSGQSGSPVYTYSEYGDSKYYTVIGIVAYDHSDYVQDENGRIMYDAYGNALTKCIVNYGPRMTTELLHFYKNNPHIDWQGKDDE